MKTKKERPAAELLPVNCLIQMPSAIHMTLVPGLMLVLAVLGINVFGDGLRDALDPRATARVPH